MLMAHCLLFVMFQGCAVVVANHISWNGNFPARAGLSYFFSPMRHHSLRLLSLLRCDCSQESTRRRNWLSPDRIPINDQNLVLHVLVRSFRRRFPNLKTQLVCKKPSAQRIRAEGFCRLYVTPAAVLSCSAPRLVLSYHNPAFMQRCKAVHTIHKPRKSTAPGADPMCRRFQALALKGFNLEFGGSWCPPKG
jgi:hypothetical protein